MSTLDSYLPLVRTIDLVLAERRESAARGPLLIIDHRFRQRGAELCSPGEEIALIWLNCNGECIPLRLSLTLRIFGDYLARHRGSPQSAAQIEAGIRTEAFYTMHAKNARPTTTQIRALRRSAVKVCVQRFRQALCNASLSTGLILDSKRVLLSESTDSNEVVYRLKARVEWRHSETR